MSFRRLHTSQYLFHATQSYLPISRRFSHEAISKASPLLSTSKEETVSQSEISNRAIPLNPRSGNVIVSPSLSKIIAALNIEGDGTKEGTHQLYVSTIVSLINTREYSHGTITELCEYMLETAERKERKALWGETDFNNMVNLSWEAFSVLVKKRIVPSDRLMTLMMNGVCSNSKSKDKKSRLRLSRLFYMIEYANKHCNIPLHCYQQVIECMQKSDPTTSSPKRKLKTNPIQYYCHAVFDLLVKSKCKITPQLYALAQQMQYRHAQVLKLKCAQVLQIVITNKK
ncbi:hypothetical protein RFI_12149 [Reticulomyxa filosa]|uniref:Uncharacterized protein n=1 Tax=Reticulomyxa filosa TaxID=46433 RepID=X6NGZ8_RETFI|nr:hypothetical protein RFI_12149 [Reticulomyxa filosa]|eukprot:ETO24994.1 hypothetical protein RFI_12149 [Reticulomyxa filosa]